MSVVENNTEAEVRVLNDDETEGLEEGDLIVSANAQVVMEKSDRSLSEYHRWYQDGRLNLNPDWQRAYVWDEKRASALVESILANIPIPVIYLAETKEGGYEVIDGVQRLTSIFNFFDNTLPLSGLKLITSLEGRTFRDLDRKTQNLLKDATIRSFQLSSGTNHDLLFSIFERLNTGGVRLNEMEIRNCIYRGKLNELIKDIAKNTDFRASINKNNIEKRMDDRALVLRFLAFYEWKYEKASAGLKSFLNSFFEEYRDPTDKKLLEFRERFKNASRVCHSIFGDKGFRLRKKDKFSNGQWSSVPNASIFQIISTSFTRYDSNDLIRSADAIFEEYLDILEDQQWVDSVTKSTGDQGRIKYSFEEWNRRLDEIMRSIEQKDPTRAFSKSLKEELFKQNSVCALCGNEIKTLNDAVLDHIEHYWKGGQTIPTNARLAHRSCNATRPHN